MPKNTPAPATTSSGAKVATTDKVTGVDTTDTEAVTLANAEAGTTGDPVRQEHGISPAATAEQVLANGGVDTIDHTLSSVTRPDVPAEPTLTDADLKGKKVDCRVLSAVTLYGVRFEPNDVLEGVPETLATQHKGSLDSHPDAVAFARAEGYPVKQFA